MLGYCSNSPIRCDNARTLKVLNQVDGSCPKCGLFLLPAPQLSKNLHVDERVLSLSLATIMLILLVSVYVFYKTLR